MKQETSKKALLEEITQVGFAVDEMTLYLDTHPYETEAIDYLTYYVRRKNQLMKEYAYQYGPLTIVTADHRQDVWNWALLPMPWNICHSKWQFSQIRLFLIISHMTKISFFFIII